MPAPAFRLEEPTFRDGIAKYVTVTCRLYGVPRQEVDDLVQEALTKIVTLIGSFRADDGEFDQWAKGVALNVIRRHLRTVKRYVHRFFGYYPNVDDYAASDPSPEHCARQNQARCAIEDATKGISSQQTQVFILHAVHEMSHVEIGRKLCISEAMSQKDYQRARKHLALCISSEAFSVMPPFVTGCDEPVSFNKNGSRWTERSHYTGQAVAAILAFLTFVPLNQTPQMRASMTGDARVLGHVQNVVMYRSDERAAVHDEPAVFRDAPTGKPEPASRPSVHNVPTPAKVGDKRTDLQDLAPIPPFKPAPRSADHPLLGR
jgi:RNA polymerase sigma factor (sigma-70 family)